ncbi:hypothetical protein [Lactococcus fujiensis]|uniref:Uncharacterized protein n=1 Tax=Lactococcus fujiensis JCM 16395 TaxID=1291764 RepID=A0A2A5RNR7_9LACT|nr:hypothetical protein [Lactococcus fujiensis]PCS00984.1 hypothetical protein RT41_GL000774 [Lactococcus fujiensis JCM 16395]
MKKENILSNSRKGAGIGVAVVAAATFGTVSPLSAKASSVTPFTVVKVIKKNDGFHFTYDEVESSPLEMNIGYNQLDKQSATYGGGNYYTSNNPGLKATLYDGKVRFIVLDNPTRDWVIEIDEHFYGTVPVFYMTQQDSNTNYRMLEILSTGEKMTYKIGEGTLPKGSMQSIYLGKGLLSPTQVSYNRYRTYVAVWNDLYRAYRPNEHDIYLNQERKMLDLETIARIHDHAGGANAAWKILFDEGGIDHYNSLNSFYGINAAPYYYYAADQKAVYDLWADRLEVGFMLLGVPILSLLQNEMNQENLQNYSSIWQNQLKQMGLDTFDYAPL